MPSLSPPLKTTLVYTLFGLLWIFFSDRVLAWLVADPQTMTRLQTGKGFVYVAVTALLLYTLMRRDYARLIAEQEKKRRLYGATMRAVQHILHNFLQNMSFFRHLADDTHGFQPEVIDLYDQVIVTTRDEIAKLSAIEEPSEEAILRTVYPS